MKRTSRMASSRFDSAALGPARTRSHSEAKSGTFGAASLWTA